MHALLFALILALNAPGAGKGGETKPEREEQLPDQNVAFVVPEGWFVFTESVKKPGLIAAFGNESRTKLVMIVRDDKNRPTNSMGPKFEKEYERGVEAGGMGKRQWGRFVEIAGFPGYERLGRAKVSGKDTSVLNQAVIAGGRYYSVQGMFVEGEDASEDPEIRKAMASFRFLTPPTASQGFWRDANEAASPARLLGTFSGKLMVVVGVIITMVVLFKRLTESGGNRPKRRSSGRSTGYPMPPARPAPSRPPPLPGAPLRTKILPRGGVKPRHVPVRPSSPPPPPSLPS